MRIQFIVSAILLGAALSHPTKYKVDRNVICYEPEPAEVYSYHIHLLYLQMNENNTKGAHEIKDKFRAAFADVLGPDSDDDFHNDYSCILGENPTPAGPFPTAQWSVFVLPEHLEKMTIWMMQRKGDYSVLVHPNSGCEIEDHSWWAFWGGAQWPLDLSIFSYDQPFPWPEEEEVSLDFFGTQTQTNSFL